MLRGNEDGSASVAWLPPPAMRTEHRWLPVAESGNAARCLRLPCSCRHLDRQQLVVLDHRWQRTFVGSQHADLDCRCGRVLKPVTHEEMTDCCTAQHHCLR